MQRNEQNLNSFGNNFSTELNSYKTIIEVSKLLQCRYTLYVQTMEKVSFPESYLSAVFPVHKENVSERVWPHSSSSASLYTLFFKFEPLL